MKYKVKVIGLKLKVKYTIIWNIGFGYYSCTVGWILTQIHVRVDISKGEYF